MTRFPLGHYMQGVRRKGETEQSNCRNEKKIGSWLVG